MKLKSYSDEGIILARRNFGEADRILVLLTKYHGKISLLAKGVRKPKSRKRGHIEVFNHIRFQAVATQGIDLITEAEEIDQFEEFKTDLKKVSVAYYFCEVVGRVIHEDEKNTEVYELLLDSLKEIKAVTSLSSLRKEFVVKLLTIIGFLPEGAKVGNIDDFLEDVIERKINSVRVGRKMLQ